MTPELRKLILKIIKNKINNAIGAISQQEALNIALFHINEILKIPIIWVEKRSQAEAQFGAESTEEYWQALKKEIQQILIIK